jgi:hypothetical protein
MDAKVLSMINIQWHAPLKKSLKKSLKKYLVNQSENFDPESSSAVDSLHH